MNKNAAKRLPFDKYDFYKIAVQSPEDDVRFYQRIYKQIRKGKSPIFLREDFCGTGAISCEWVKLNKKYKSSGLDLDNEPMNYGRKHYIEKLNSHQKKRIALINKDVLSKGLPRADIAVAVNFSYFFFKQREMLKKYFKNVYDSLNKDGIFVIDIFGGTQCTDAIVDKTKNKKFTYYWDQKGFDPVTAEAYFEIHFKFKSKIYEGVFKYDWRMWSIPEIKEIMLEVGFKDTKVYWEGTNSQGGGNGKFTVVKNGEACLSWIAYVAGIK